MKTASLILASCIILCGCVKQVTILLLMVALLTGINGCNSTHKALDNEDKSSHKALVNEDKPTQKSIANEDEDYAYACKEDTSAHYQYFIKTYPNSSKLPEVRARFEKALQQEKNKVAESAKSLQEEKDWNWAKISNTIKTFKWFLKEYPLSQHCSEAKELLISLQEKKAEQDWPIAKTENTINGYERFLEECDFSQYATEAKERLKSLQEQKVENDWRVAQTENTVKSYERFLKENNLSRYSSEAKERIITVREEQKRTLLTRVQNGIANATDLPFIVFSGYELVNNIAIKTNEEQSVSTSSLNLNNSFIVYNGGRVSVSGTVYAKLPSKGNIWYPIDNTSFRIIGIDGVPECSGVKDVIAHTDQGELPLGYSVHNSGFLRIIIPREIIPCDIELCGVLENYIRLDDKTKN